MEKIDKNFIKPFIEGTLNTLKVQCKIDSTPEKPFIKGSDPAKENSMVVDIAGVIGVTSTSFIGNFTLCFPEALFLTLMGNMVGETFTEMNEDVESGAGELLNIIYGTVKTVLNSQGYSLQRAIPTVVRGKNILMAQLK